MPPFSMTRVNCILHFIAKISDIIFNGDLKCRYVCENILQKQIVALQRVDEADFEKGNIDITLFVLSEEKN